MIFLRGVVAGS